MFLLSLLADSFRHPRQFPPRAFDLPLGLLPLRAGHLRHRLSKSPVGAMQDGHRHVQIARHLFHHRRLGWRRLPLRFQKQFRLGQNALARHPRAFAPGCVELPGLPRIATVLDEHRRHPLALLPIHAGYRHQILQRHWRRNLACAHLLLDRFRQPLH
jgi:hypothetical protein